MLILAIFMHIVILVNLSNCNSVHGISRFVTSADGTHIFAEATGNPRGNHLVLVHGFGLAAAAMDRLFFDASMNEKFFMVRYDLRGHGQSGKPLTAVGYTSEKWAQDFSAVTAAFQLKDIILIGWSYGGSVSADVISNIRPNPLKAIVSLAAPTLGPSQQMILTDVNKAFGVGLLATNDSILSLRTRIEFVDTCFARPEIVPYTLRSEWVGFTVSQTPDITALIVNRTQDITAFSDAGKAGLPMLVIGGALDALINMTTLIEVMSQDFINLESHLIPDQGHAVFFDGTSETVHHIIDFVHRLNSKKKDTL